MATCPILTTKIANVQTKAADTSSLDAFKLSCADRVAQCCSIGVSLVLLATWIFLVGLFAKQLYSLMEFRFVRPLRWHSVGAICWEMLAKLPNDFAEVEGGWDEIEISLNRTFKASPSDNPIVESSSQHHITSFPYRMHRLYRSVGTTMSRSRACLPVL